MIRTLLLRGLVVAGALLLGLTGPVRAQGNKVSRDQAAAVNTELAIAYTRENNLAGAREKTDKALAQTPPPAKAQTAAGFIYDRPGDARKASPHYDQAVKLGKD